MQALNLDKVIRFFRKPFFTEYRTILILWLLIALKMGIMRTISHKLHNNYQVYKHVFWNVLDQLPLYQPQPQFYGDQNHYGPIFSLIIAPFAVLPDVIGATLWLVFLGLVLFFAIKELPLQQWQHMVILWISTNSLFGAFLNVQFNIAIAALLILSYTLIRKEKDAWAAFMIVLGTFVKIYGIVGLAFFFFSKHKPKLILWCIIWSAVFFALPMIISSPEYIIGQYKAWMIDIIEKSGKNNNSLEQNISFLGMVRRTTGHLEWSNIPMLLGGALLFFLPYLNYRKFSQERFQLLILASVLNFVVLFSTGSETNSYLIAMIGVSLWFVIQKRPFNTTIWGLFIYAIIFTGFVNSDIFPHKLYHKYIFPNALQALPCTLVWLKIIYELTFSKTKATVNETINSNSNPCLQ
jgi:Protein of unknown function (DUF2029).